jgi:thiaminase (transcriptional activator TenA)
MKMLFTELAREKSAKYWEMSFEHPFIEGLVTGNLSSDVFRYYLLQDRYYLEHFSKLYLYIAEKTEDKMIREHLKLNAEELKEGEIFIREGFFRDLDITEQEISETAIAPTAYHYVSHMYRQLVDGTVNTAIAGMLPCAWLYHEIGLRLIVGVLLTPYTNDGLKHTRVKRLRHKSKKSVPLSINFIKKVMSQNVKKCLKLL